MPKPFIILSLSALALVWASRLQPQTQTAAPAAPASPPAAEKIPADAVNAVNPVTPTPELEARAKKIYGYDCAMCHGAAGDGAGDVAKGLKTKVPDFRDPNTFKGQTDGELFYIIKNGKGEMDGEGARAKPEETWTLVRYVRSFATPQSSDAQQPK